MRLPKYGEYKDSGIPWLGTVPRYWEVQRFKWLIERNDGGVWGDDPDGVDDTVVLRSTEQTVDGHWQIDEPAKRKLSEKDRLFALLAIGDLLLTKSSGSALHIGKTTLVDWHVAALGACYSNFMQRIRVGDLLCPKFAWYILNNGLARVQLDLLSNSTTGLANLNGTVIGELLVALPPQEEQAAIVAFLDRETAKIDALIAEQERLIALLAEKRQATISHAVTRGLNPDAPMKASGVAWLGNVPATWQLRTISSLSTKITNGYVGPTRDILVDDGVRYLQSLHIKSNRIRFDAPYYVSEEWSAKHAKSILVPDDVLIVQTGDIGQVACVTEEFAGCNCHALIIVSPIDSVASGRWISQVLDSSYGKHSLLSIQTGALHPHLNCGNVRELILPIPPKVEQAQILEFVTQETKRVDALAYQADRAVTLLRERRSALIAAAVTGQIDVRDTVAI